ncbi:hypothetical protein EJ02DRAFT_472530 [Clathrospora elynae]|uniref:Carrier domain-containing protein n=1 Tax=Clathrospora elynae TaxID=706981 RepID=A0A6A5TGP6_9PLEO|nr:hypothetical protein EJ02DRAFT_472530 [Clathrospora elynae]
MPQRNGRSQRLSIVNERPSIIDGPGLLHELVQSTSLAPAIEFLEDGSTRRRFEYKTLHSLSDCLATKITMMFAKLESASPIIPILLPQCPELYVVLLAVLKAGKAFCPLSLDTPAERLKFVLQDVSAEFLITSSDYGDRIRAITELRTVFVDRELSERGEPPRGRLPKPSTNDLAYVLYTSGSTGQPKAVSVSHRAVTQSLLAHDRHIPDFTRFLQFAAPTFDVSIFEIFFPWLRGRTLVGCTRAQMLDDLPGTINKLEVDAAELTPTVVGNLLNGRSSVPGLKLLLTIGEMLTQHVVDEYGGDEARECILWAMYGPTEGAIHCTLQPHFSTSLSANTIGYPLDTVSAFIIAPNSEEDAPANIEVLPVGEVGELAIGGPQVAEEYLNRPELTAASFVQHPDYGRLYRTGDRAKLCKNGVLECLGRIVAGQVKFRGQRVELGEIEHAIMKIDSCRTATVMVIEDRLVAFCATGSQKVSRADVLETCRSWLPSSMVPSDVSLMDSVPHLPSGKIDKVSLEANYLSMLHASITSTSPDLYLQDPLSHTVLGILKNHTTHDLAMDSKLAFAGLDSLRSIFITSALRQEGFNLGAMDILLAATPGDVIAACRNCNVTNGHHTLPESPTEIPGNIDIPQLKRWQDEIACILPCTPLQEAMLAETITKSSAYCNWVEIELLTSRTYDQTRDVLRHIAQTTEILRTGFWPVSQDAGTFVQVIWKDLLPSQIREVISLSKAYTLDRNDAFLRPFNVQVCMSSERPRILFQMHHALYDGWSFDLILHDLDRRLQGEEPARRPQFREVVRHFTRKLRQDDHDSAMGYWTHLLENYVPAVLPNYNGKLVSDSGVHRYSGRSMVNKRLLFGRARELAVSPQVFFQAATAYILRLYTGSTDVVFGNVTSGRTIPVTGVEDIIGPCIATIPFRFNFTGNLRVREILHKTQSQNRDSLRHSTLPLRNIARAANVRPGARLFDVLLVWQQSLSSTSDSLLTAKIVDSADDLEFRITLEFEPREDYISFRATFDPSTIPEHQIKYLSRQIDEVVRLFLRDPSCEVTSINHCFSTSSLSIANPDPRQQAIEYGPSHTVERWASRDPDREAIVFGHFVDGLMEIKDTMTYGLLNSCANQFARVLVEHGVGQDQLVGVVLEKSIDLYVSILAVLKLGCGYLPLVPDTPIDRVRTIFNDAQVAVCISDSSISTALRQGLSVDLVDFDLTELSGYSNQNLNVPYNGQHLAYAVFTSGSTGTPKGVLITQNNLMSNLQYLSSIYPFSAESRMLQSCSQAFDVSVFEIFFSWYVGICLCTAKKDDLFRDFEAAINRLEVTHLSLTPTVAALVNPKNVPKVMFLVTAGEALTENVRRSWAGRGLYQGYGPSETTNICTVRAAVTAEDLINNIGSPFDNTSAFVLDPEGDAVLPRGAIGELCFGGTQVFRGYLNKAELSAAKIITHPSYGRVYRSGDMGILLPDCSILSTGRSDDQVKIRGQRVELGEINSLLLDHEVVRNCVTLLFPRSNNTKTLVSFWVPTTNEGEPFQSLEPTEFRSVILGLFDLLSRQLPSYMIPSHLVPVSCLPMTVQAKIDKRRLQQLFNSSAEGLLFHTAQSYDTGDEPEISSQWGMEVAGILARMLDLPVREVRRTSSFFNLGLDSVSAIRLCNELRMANLGDFSVAVVLKNPTIAHLASVIGTKSSTKRSAKAPATELVNVFKPDQVSQILARYKQRDLRVAKILPCTPLQEAMLSSGQSPSGSAYFNVMVFDIKGDISQLQECWARMVQRHEILRTSFVSTEDSTYAFAQVILEAYQLVWHHHSSEDNLKSRTNQVLSDLLEANKPPVYFALAQEDTSMRLIFCCHHALYDGIAVAILIKEIQDLYLGYELPAPISYEVYLQHMLDQDHTEADRYWTALLKDFEPTFFPNLTCKALKSQGVPASISRRLNIPLSDMRRACQSASVSLLSVVHAAWAKVMHFYTGESDICFGNIVSGRTFPGEELDRLVAPCFNTLPVRVNFDFQRDNSALTSLTHYLNIDTLAYQLTPLRRIQNATLKGGGRLFDTLVILQQPTPPLDLSIWSLEHDLGDMDLPVICEVVQDPTEDILNLVLHYHTSLLSEAEAALVTETFDESFSSIVRHPQASANDTVGLPAHLRAESNMEFQNSSVQKRFLHSGIERIALLHPDRLALDFLHPDGARTTWSFRTLNERANAIAHVLIDHGLGPEDVVPIHMSKSPYFYATMLGVLKAGAAFAPVHPDLPEARKKLMLTELNPKLIMCSDDSLPSRVLTGAKILNVGVIKHHPLANPTNPGLKSSDLAYCLFTSGSTGIPKAVSMEHRAPIQTIESSRNLVPWTSASRLLQYAAVTFDMCYYDCFLAWTFGFALCTAEQTQLLNDLPKVINDLNVDLLDLTPSVAVSLRRSAIPSVKWLYCIGEAMSSNIAKEWDGACVNSYGPTEAAFCTTIHRVSNDTATSIIGKPFPTTSFAVLPPQGDRPLPVLGIGELYIGGAQLARGYLGKSELTDDRFVIKRGHRFYKSGDLVRMLSDGNFDFIGRADDQVKIRGLRVELGEINHVLQDAHPEVTSVTTQILKKDAAAREQLVAFLVLTRQNSETERTELQSKLKSTASKRLPSYMIPQFFLFVEDIPRSMAGKIDKNVLAKIFREFADVTSLPNGNGAYASEHKWTEVEAQVRDVLARLSQTSLESILPTTSIYQLGLDSISAVQIAASLRKICHGLSATDVMKHATCTDLAAFIDQAPSLDLPTAIQFDFDGFERKHKALVLSECDIKGEDVAAIRPCTPLQKGMISQFLANEGAVNMNYLRLQLESGVDPNKLREAWTMTMKIHSILRTGFAHVKDALHPFAMIQYTPNAARLPWGVGSDDDSSQSIDNWLRKIQRRALHKLQSPAWEIRTVQQGGQIYLDIAIFHALFDAQSLQSIFMDVAAAYHGQSLPPPCSLDAVISVILGSSEQDTKGGRCFWTDLGKKINPCRFPNLAPLRYDPTSLEVCTRQSSRSLLDLKSGCREANTTLQAAGIASWLSLLSAYTGEPSVTCGVVLSGRNFEAAEHAVFPCINTVPFTCTATTDRREMLASVMKLNAEVQQNQFIPLNEIQKMMGVPNGALFDTIFAYQKLPGGSNENDIWSVVDERATTEYPLSIELELRRGYLEYRLTFLPHVIPKEQACLILDQLDHMMESFVFHANLNAAETLFHQQLYSITPAREHELPSHPKLLHELVEHTATKHPHRIALEFVSARPDGGRAVNQWTYSELDAEGVRIAQLLIAHGIQPGSLIGVCFEKCAEASFAILGILKAGCAFVAIDPGAPAARKAFIIKDSQAKAVLSMSAQSCRFAADVDVPILNLDEIEWHSLPPTKPLRNRGISPQDRSYCLYTSGTTGTPKGCELTHENAVQALLAFQRLFAGHWNTKSRWLQFASFHFDVSVLEQYWSWSVGICVVSAPRDLIFEDLAKSINSLGITHIDLTPSLAQILHPNDVPNLCEGVFITGGESLKQEILDVWGPKGVIYNGYGPTEATIGCTMYPRVPANGKPSNIGRQFDNVGSFVLQLGSDIPVLRGGVGELCVSGKLVGKGYLNRPELTAERFPYLERFEERVYRTGDMVRILHDGTFDFLGRADDQVKLRGQRLEVGEINSVIKQSGKDISDVSTLVLKHPKQQKEQLVAFTVLGKGSGTEARVLLKNARGILCAKEACHEKLPPYMIPTHFVPLTSMPLNVNNKADGGKLKEIYEALSASDLQKLSATSNEDDEPWPEKDQKIREVLSGTLDVSEESIGKDTSFFELGMDSISVIGVSRAMKQAFFANATASVVMQCPTIRRLSKALSIEHPSSNNLGSVLAAKQAMSAVQHRHKRTVARSLSIETSDIEALAPCTPLQQGMIARYLRSENALYFNNFQFVLHGNINEKKLQMAWKSVYTSTQILRTVFLNTDGGYIQAVIRDSSFSGVIKTVAMEERLVEHLVYLRQRWLDLNHTELRQPFEIHLVTTPKQKLLIVHIFHGLYDGNSIGLIFKNLWDVYNGRKMDNDAPSFHSALAHGPLRVVEGAKRFWQDHLSKATFAPFPVLSDEPAEKATFVTRQLHALTAFESIRRQLNVTAQAIAQACWLSVLQKHIKGTVATGIVVSGRSIDLEGADRIMGPMFNTLPYQPVPQRSESWACAIKRVHEFNVASHPYQHTPLRDITKWCKRSPDQPLFNSLFVYQIKQDDEEWANNEAWEVLDGDAVADYPLAFEVEQKPDDVLKVTLVTQGHISSEQTSNELLDRFEEALRKVLSDPSATLELPVESTGIVENGAYAEAATKKSNSTSDFKWTDDAIKIREDLASICDIESKEIDETTSIFELGLDSIDFIKLSSMLKKRNVDLPVSGIMRGLTIEKMLPNIASKDTQKLQSSSHSNFVARQQKLRDYLEKCEIDMSDIEGVLPLTPLQEAMIAEMVASGYTRYFNYDVLKLDPITDIGKLRDAWTKVVAASPILRTGFVEVDDPELDDSFAQIIHRQPHGFCSHIKVTHEPRFPELFERLRSDTIGTSLSTPPFRVTVVESPNQSYVLMSIAHALYDGWSLGLLHSDVHRAYSNQFAARPSYERTLAEILSASGTNAAGFWQDYLAGTKTSSLPRLPTDLRETGGIVHRHQQDSELALADIFLFAKKSDVSLQAIGQTIFALVLASYTQSLDVIFGSVLSGRDDNHRSQLLFPIMNTVAIRTIIHGTGIAMLRYVQDNLTSIKQWQHYPLRKALSHAGVDGRLFESLFIYQKSLEEGPIEMEKLHTSVEGHSDVEYPICVEMEVVNRQLVWRCALKEEVFDEAGAKQLLYRLDYVLRYMMERPKVPVIHVTTQGASLCGLPAFEEARNCITDDRADIDGEHDENLSNTQTAQTIREVLAAVSKTSEDEITSDMTIFHMGLDSISAIKVSSLLRKQSIVLSVGEMLRAGTVEKMARIVDARVAHSTEGNDDYNSIIRDSLRGLDRAGILKRADIDDANVAELLPVTAGQLYMLSMWLNTKGGNFYPEFTYKLQGSIDIGILQLSWQKLITANPILRTAFLSTDDAQMPYVQIVLKEAENTVIDTTGCTEEEAVVQSRRVALKQPWAHLFASRTLSVWNLKLKIHHALYDGVSLPILMQQLQDICNSVPTPSVDNTFARFIASGCIKLALKEQKSFWTKYLKDTKQVGLSQPSTTPTSRVEEFRPALLQTSSLDATARKHGVSIQTLFLAAYAKLFAAMKNTPSSGDVLIGVYLANRSLPIDGIVSAAIPTVNILPLRISSPLNHNLVESASQIQSDLRDISSPAIAFSSLYEISKWTGVKVDTFVNFVSLPDAEETEKNTAGSSVITMKPTEQWQDLVSRVYAGEDRSSELLNELVNERFNGAYMQGIDVEATIRNGSLDVGVFAPTDMLSLEEGKKLVEDIRRQLESVNFNDS